MFPYPNRIWQFCFLFSLQIGWSLKFLVYATVKTFSMKWCITCYRNLNFTGPRYNRIRGETEVIKGFPWKQIGHSSLISMRHNTWKGNKTVFVTVLLSTMPNWKAVLQRQWASRGHITSLFIAQNSCTSWLMNEHVLATRERGVK